MRAQRYKMCERSLWEKALELSWNNLHSRAQEDFAYMMRYDLIRYDMI